MVEPNEHNGPTTQQSEFFLGDNRRPRPSTGDDPGVWYYDVFGPNPDCGNCRLTVALDGVFVDMCIENVYFGKT